MLYTTRVWSVVYTDEALRTLARMPRNTAARIGEKVTALARDPLRPNNNVRRLTGRPEFRLRVGDWRVLFELNHGRLIVHVLAIGPRSSIYE